MTFTLHKHNKSETITIISLSFYLSLPLSLDILSVLTSDCFCLPVFYRRFYQYSFFFPCSFLSLFTISPRLLLALNGTPVVALAMSRFWFFSISVLYLSFCLSLNFFFRFFSLLFFLFLHVCLLLTIFVFISLSLFYLFFFFLYLSDLIQLSLLLHLYSNSSLFL